MLIPVQQDFELYPGGTFDPLLEFYTDRAKTVLFDLTGYSVVLRIGSKWSDPTNTCALLELTGADGLTLGGSGGTVQIVVTAEQTSTLLEERRRRRERRDQDHVLVRLPWYLQWTSPAPASKVDYPVAGMIAVTTP
jgi:hypothetical protein